MNTKAPASLAFILLVLGGCSKSAVSIRLDAIDSLVVVEKYDSAYHEVLKMKPPFDKASDLAHYQLLLTQTSYLTNHTLPTDATIDSAITFYEKDGNPEKLADAYYYKASRLNMRKEPTPAITIYKKAEDAAAKTDNLRLKYKIAESIAKVNLFSGNYRLSVECAKKALAIALEAENKNWTAYSYYHLSQAYVNAGNIDSFSINAKSLIPFVDDAYPADRPYMLANIGFMYYKDGQYDLAKDYYKKSLALHPIAHTMENLADVYVKEGNVDEAYRLWQEAFLMNDGSTKDFVLFNMLQYDLGRHRNLKDACERLYRFYVIKDSMMNTLKDRTIQDLQQQYDADNARHEHEKARMKWMFATLLFAIAVILVVAYSRYRRYRMKLSMARQQMLLSQYSNNIAMLKSKMLADEHAIREYSRKVADYEDQIRSLQSPDGQTGQTIDELRRLIGEINGKNRHLQEECAESGRQVMELEQRLAELLDKISPLLVRGKVLHDRLLEGNVKKGWEPQDVASFLEYYKMSHIVEYERLEKKFKGFSPRQALYLILSGMGKDTREIAEVMGVSPEAVRSIRHRLKGK